MPKIAALTQTTTKVALQPVLLKKLRQSVRTYFDAKQRRDEADADMSTAREVAEEVLEAEETTNLEVDDFKVSIISPVRTTLDVKKLLQLGVKPDIIEKATVKEPGTPYTKITRLKEK